MSKKSSRPAPNGMPSMRDMFYNQALQVMDMQKYNLFMAAKATIFAATARALNASSEADLLNAIVVADKIMEEIQNHHNEKYAPRQAQPEVVPVEEQAAEVVIPVPEEQPVSGDVVINPEPVGIGAE